MKTSWIWLSELIDLAGFTPEELAHRLTMSGLQVASIETKGQGMETVIVGRLQNVHPHPNADKLSLTEVEIPGRILQIVCGAKNIAPGDVVPIALEGTTLPNGLKIKQAKIRGIESMGMICSESELGLAKTSEGIMQLPKDTPLGTSVTKLLALSDVILDIEVTPNRSDCLSHLGIARHLSALLDRPLKNPEPRLAEIEPPAVNELQINIEQNSGCYRYCARIVRDVIIAPSPIWMQRRLETSGIRPINNVVDITNYVLLEIGHPLHAFDLDTLVGKTIHARRAQNKEKFITLDGVERVLTQADLVIADDSRAIALAGVMGGMNSEVSTKTRNILLEAAWFDPSLVRSMSRRLNCMSESSYRFERGIDPEFGLKLALDRAAQYLAELAGGKILRGAIDHYPQKHKTQQITLRLERIQTILGVQPDPQLIKGSLSRLGFTVEGTGQPDTGVYQIKVPSFRHDVSIEEDLIEEVAEMVGYDKIPVQQPFTPLLCPPADPKRDFIHSCREMMANLGLDEAINFSFHAPNQYVKLRLPADHSWRAGVQIKNPISEETSYLRTSLLPGLIENISYNQRRGQERMYFYEIGSVFHPVQDQPLPNEPTHLGVAITGTRSPLHWRFGKKRPVADFYDLKGVLEGLWQRLNLKTKPAFMPAELPFLHPMISFRLLAPDSQELGWAGSLHPETQETFKLKEPVFVAELDLTLLQTYCATRPVLKSFSIFPSAVRDISLAVPKEIQAGDIIQTIFSIGKELVVDAQPFDVYQGKELEADTKSIAFTLVLQAQDRTLSDEEMNQFQDKILKHLQNKFKAKQR